MDVRILYLISLVRLDNGSKMFFFLVILFSNILFLSFWLYKMYEEIKNTLRTNLQKVYLYLWLCGNKKRLENEITRRAIQDENDILKEEFDRRILFKFNFYRTQWN